MPLFKKAIEVPVFQGSTVHLGDNIFSRVGGKNMPTKDDPTNQSGTLVYYDKENNSFSTNFGLPDIVQTISSHYSKIYQSTNIDAWRHIEAIDLSTQSKPVPSYENQIYQLDFSTLLIWHENHGNFYLPNTPVAIVDDIDLYNILKENGFSPDSERPKKIIFWFSGLHGGLEKGQDNNVDLIINTAVYPLEFNTDYAKQKGTVGVFIDPNDLSFSSDYTNSIGVIVRPFQEHSPVPPASFKGDKRGPGHFRDIEIGNCSLELIY